MFWCVFAGYAFSVASAEIAIRFDEAEVGKPLTNWAVNGVVFKLAHEPRQSKAAGRIVLFPHLGTDRKGILCAMATEPIPVQVRFPKVASSVTLALWGSTGCPALLEAFDPDGQLVDKASVARVPGRTKPEDSVPSFELTVKASRITYVCFSGPRSGEFLAAEEIRYTPIPDPAK